MFGASIVQSVLMRKTLLLLLSFVLSLALSGCTLGTGLLAGPQSPEERAAAGNERFLRYCASCHGREAKGGGPVAGALKRPPADLTRIELRRGRFDPDFLASFIDGRVRVEEHGPGDMPVWGRVLDAEDEQTWREGRPRPPETQLPPDNPLTPGAIALIIDYLRSVQVE